MVQEDLGRISKAGIGFVNERQDGMTEGLLHRDAWLSELFDRPVYFIRADEGCCKLLEQEPGGLHEAIGHAEDAGPVFVFTKVPTHRTRTTAVLERTGFCLTDTSLVFDRPGDLAIRPRGKVKVRETRKEEQDAVRKIARENFVFSRFHLDPAIDNNLANRIKEEWAGNFFTGSRGDRMIVGEIDGQVAGFIQAIEKPGTNAVIDLIGVDQRFRRQSVGYDMIAYLADTTESAGISVGTQACNIGAVRLYERAGFSLAKSIYIFHYHSKNQSHDYC